MNFNAIRAKDIKAAPNGLNFNSDGYVTSLSFHAIFSDGTYTVTFDNGDILTFSTLKALKEEAKKRSHSEFDAYLEKEQKHVEDNVYTSGAIIGVEFNSSPKMYNYITYKYRNKGDEITISTPMGSKTVTVVWTPHQIANDRSLKNIDELEVKTLNSLNTGSETNRTNDFVPTHAYKPKDSQWGSIFGHHDTNYVIRTDARFGYALTVYRQSGNVQHAYHCGNLESAIGQMNKHLNRNSRKPNTTTNTSEKLVLTLPHAGRNNEGKRIGSFEIVALDKPYDDWVSDQNTKGYLLQFGIVLLFIVIALIQLS
ncbi:hypothetical protein MWT97_004319 [Vibrio vulnificus]|nr:hypothetical protein [Vibrio vulnificus]